MADEAEMKFCSNCKRDIAAVNFIMHEVHCRRNIVLCENCEEPVPRSELEPHFDEYHAQEACEICKELFEKCKMEDHMPVCPRRPQQCAYCELEMPFSELAGHQDYCGTRTEPCPLCGQYIMCKDQSRHEDSNCTYPAPKPKQNNTATSNVAPNNSYLYDMQYVPSSEDFFNNFAMDEMSRMLHTEMPGRTTMPYLGNEGSQGRTNRTRRGISGNRTTATARTNTVPSRTNATRARQNTQGNPPRNVPANRPTRQAGSHSSHMSRGLLNNERNPPANQDRRPPANMSRKVSSQNGRTSPVNRDPNYLANQDLGPPVNHDPSSAANQDISSPVNQDPSYSANPDLDHLLAMHLATDLGEEQNWSFLDNPHCINPANLVEADSHDLPPQQPQDNSGDFTLPCEFCDCTFPAHLLLDHQELCAGPSVHDGVIPAAPLVTSPGTSHEYNNSPTAYSSGPTEQLHVVDNLSYLEAHNRLSDPVEYDSVVDDEIFLPCEFCEQQFPQEYIVQHQAVCDGNMTQTPPRRTSPVSRVRPSRVPSQPHARPKKLQSAVLASSNSRVTKRQQDPDISRLLPDETGAAGAYNLHGNSPAQRTTRLTNKNHTSSMPSRPANGIAKGGSSSRPKNFSTSASQPRASQPRAPRVPRDNIGAAESEENGPERRRRGSAARVHDTLDELLMNPTYTTQDLMNYVEKEDLMNYVEKEKKSLQNQLKREETHLYNNRSEYDAANSQHRRRPPRDNSMRGASNVSRPTYESSFASRSPSATYSRGRARNVIPKNLEPDLETSSSFRVNARENTSMNRGKNTKKSTRPRRHPQGDA